MLEQNEINIEMLNQNKVHSSSLPEDNQPKKYSFEGIIGESKEMQEVYELIAKTSDSDSTVLISGDTGTGKEVVARAICMNSLRKDAPFIPVNCGAIPEGLLESELFGHEKGAFSGAIYTRIGRFELAEGGTIFLDEVSEMSPSLQVKLLRAIQERSIERVGGIKSISLDVRIIAATNQNLEEAIKNKSFRKDLYYRLNVIPIHLPPLRARGNDLELLLNYNIAYFNQKKKKDLQGLSPKALEVLKKYTWPGNVRELENFVERIAILKGTGIIELEDLPEKFFSQQGKDEMGQIDFSFNKIDFNAAVNEFERNLIVSALEKANGVKNKAAEILSLKRTTLIEKIKRLNLDENSPDDDITV